MQSGNTYRFKPDGSHIEQCTWGQVNPFGLAFDPLGNLYSGDCHSQPIYQLLRGGYYPSFGKPHDGLGFAPEMIDARHGSTAIAGIVYYAADQFPAGVSRQRLHRRRGHQPHQPRIALELARLDAEGDRCADFLNSDDPWFRPVDIKLGPDGALYVADFYNRIIGHYEVPLNHPGRDRERGRIWRIVYAGTDGKTQAAAAAPTGRRRRSTELVADLGHPNLTVRLTAANQLVERGGEEGSTR